MTGAPLQSVLGGVRTAFVLVVAGASAAGFLLGGCDGFGGHQGARGDQGDPGEAGPPGAPGATGATGPAGHPGPDGAPGPRGPDGSTGVAGEAGATGPRGAAGAAGEAGLGLVGLYGDGFDGTVTLTADTTLARDMYYSDLTLSAGVTLHPAGFRVFVQNVLTLGDGAAIDRSGGTATIGTAAALAAGSLGGGGAGQPVNDCSANGGNVTNSLGGNAGSFGGIVYGTATPPAIAVGGAQVFDAVASAVTGRTLDGTPVTGGAGGSLCSGQPANGGGGGVIVIAARVVTLSGTSATFSANGGNASGNAPAASALLGGGGGVIVVVSEVPEPTGLTLSVTGGTSVGTDATPGSVGTTVWLD